jgi:Tfp pilus assembly PilM family ATPase
MAKRCIGIDISSSHLCAVQVLRIGKAFCVEKVFDSPGRRDTDSPSDTLKKLVGKHGFDRRAAVAISVPNDAVFFRNVEANSAGSGQPRRPRSLEFEYEFPIEPDEIIAQPCSRRRTNGESRSLLMTAVTKDSLRQTRDIALAARMRPDLIGAAVFAIHSTVALNHPEIRTADVAVIAYVAESHMALAITRHNSISAIRNFPIVAGSDNGADSIEEQIADVLSREIGITWRKLFDTEINRDVKIYLVTGHEDAVGLQTAIEENLPCQTTIVNPYARVLLKHRRRTRANMSVAEGLALRTLAPEYTTGVNFLEADNASVKPTFNLKREIVICAVLVAAIAAVSLIGLFTRLSHLETEYALVNDKSTEIFKHVLPEEKNIVNPLAQLEQELQSLRKDHALLAPISSSSTGPLEVLRAVTLSTPPSAGIILDDMLITTELVRLTGTAQTFESVYNWQRLLQGAPPFSVVDVRDVRREPESELVNFTVLISFAQKE